MLIAPILMAVAVLFRIFPPKRINPLYGYRTERSMSSQEIWDEANRYSANLLLVLSAALCGYACAAMALFEGTVPALSTAAGAVAGLIALVALTERHLNRTFGRDGTKMR
jgi:uncharacterized membrane protein